MIHVQQPEVLRHYAPAGPVTKKFHESSAFFRGLMGPIGSGKSTACVIEILRRARQQAPGPDGVRRSRWAVIRNSYPELKTTTIKTWEQWVPLHYGKMDWGGPIRHHIKTADMDLEVLFLALDRDEDARKLLSLELTGGWINEAREVPKAVWDALSGRVGRYPGAQEGGCTWSGIIADTNPPDDQSEWYRLAEQDTPHNWEFFRQPGGKSEGAENLNWLLQTPKTLALPLDHPARLARGREYYERLEGGKEQDWVKVYVHGEYGYVVEGRPVYPMYRDSIHTAGAPIDPVPELPLLLGLDFGLTPAAVIGQKLADGRWLILDELCADDCGITRFSELLAKYIAERYPRFKVGGGWCDPAGNARDSDEKTAYAIVRQKTGWKWHLAPTNEFELRREVVVNTLNRLVDGKPGLWVSPKCTTVRKGMVSGYHFKPVRSANGTQYHDTPAKNKYSHPCEAMQYLLLGGGEHAIALGKKTTPRGQREARDVDFNVFS